MPLIGNIEDLKWNYEEEASGGSKSPVLINTPRLEVRIIVLAPGQCPPYHRHHKEMDEGYLIRQGRGLLTIDGEKFEVRAGDVLLGKRGGYHNLLNIGDEDLIEFNFRGGKMPSGFIAPEDDGETPGVDVSGGTPETATYGGISLTSHPRASPTTSRRPEPRMSLRRSFSSCSPSPARAATGTKFTATKKPWTRRLILSGAKAG